MTIFQTSCTRFQVTNTFRVLFQKYAQETFSSFQYFNTSFLVWIPRLIFTVAFLCAKRRAQVALTRRNGYIAEIPEPHLQAGAAGPVMPKYPRIDP